MRIAKDSMHTTMGAPMSLRPAYTLSTLPDMIMVRDNRLLLRGRTAGTQLSPLYILAGQVVSELSEHCALYHDNGLLWTELP